MNIVSYEQGGTKQPAPLDSFDLTARSAEISYAAQNADGTPKDPIDFAWDTNIAG